MVVGVKILWYMDHHAFFSRKADFLKQIEKRCVFSYFRSPVRNSSCKLFTTVLSFKVDSCLGLSVPESLLVATGMQPFLSVLKLFCRGWIQVFSFILFCTFMHTHIYNTVLCFTAALFGYCIFNNHLRIFEVLTFSHVLTFFIFKSMLSFRSLFNAWGFF